MPMNLGEEKTALLSEAIAEIVANYSKNENVDSIFMDTNIIEGGIPSIRLNIIYINPLNFKDILSVEKQVKELQSKVNIKVSADFCDSRNYGLCGLYIMSCGGTSSCNRLVNGKILFDRNEKFSKIQAKAIELSNTYKLKSSTSTLNISRNLRPKVCS